MHLDTLPLRQKMRISSIDWSQISENEGRRLRALGIEAGASIEALHRGTLFWRDPIAVRVGRMSVAIRSKTAAAIICEDLSENMAPPSDDSFHKETQNG